MEGIRPGIEAGATRIATPRPRIARAMGMSIAVRGGSSFCASTKMATAHIQVMLIAPTARNSSISPPLEPTQFIPKPSPEWLPRQPTSTLERCQFVEADHDRQRAGDHGAVWFVDGVD